MQQSVSDRKRAANRANAQKSTGPTSPQGKQAVRHNALQHGMYAVTTAVRLPIDDPHIFHALHCEWHRLYTPRDIEEHALLEAFVASHWRYIRQLNIENRIYTTEFKSQDELRARGNSLQPDPSDPIACIAYAFRGLSSLDVCNRNIARLERSWLKLLDQLRKMHKRPDSAIIAPLAPELRQPPPPPEVTPEPQPAAPSAAASKKETTKPPAETASPVESLVNLVEKALFGGGPPAAEVSSPGQPPRKEPPTRD
jgi:hypothetical protein